MKTYRKLYLIITFLLLIASFQKAYTNDQYSRSLTLQYLQAKSRGNYNQALQILFKWSLKTDNSAELELNLFRINELMVFPEMYSKGENILTVLGKSINSKNNFRLRDRIDIFRNKLSLLTGKFKQSEHLQNSLSFFSFYALGPFTYNNRIDFESPLLPEKEIHFKKSYKGKHNSITWFQPVKNREGYIDFNSHYNTIGNSIFYLYRNITIDREDDYYLIFGKTGYTDIWINNTNIFKSRVKHGFQHDQYYLKIHFTPGNYSLLVKTASCEDGIKFAMRMTNSNGTRITLSGLSKKKILNTRLINGINISKIPALTFYSSNNEKSDLSIFNRSTLLYFGKFRRTYNQEADNSFSEINKSSPFYSTSLYYLGKLESSDELKEYYYRKSLGKKKDNLESILGIIDIKIRNNYLYDVYPFIKKIKRINTGTPYYQWSLAKLYRKKKWHFQLLQSSKSLKNSSYQSIGYLLESIYHLTMEDYIKAEKELKILQTIDPYNATVTDKLVNCMINIGAYRQAINMLHKAIRIHPEAIHFRLRLQELIKNTKSDRDALPYVTTILNIAPDNKNALKSIGMIYHKLKKDDLSRHFLIRAQQKDPDDTIIKSYLQLLSKEKTSKTYLFSRDISALIKKADKYGNEPAVTILDEVAITISNNNSYEKHVRKVYKINSHGVIKDLRNYFIVVDPSTETLKNLECYLYGDGKKIKITDTFKKSLSDPESRLYYNLNAIIIPIHSLSKGNILDISYTIKNRSGNIYKNYFGKKFIIGNKFRTLYKNIIFSYPNNRTFHYSTKGLNKNTIQKNKTIKHNVYRTIVKNIPPASKENNMPHFSDITPSLYFTSFRNWNQLSIWYRSLLTNRITVTREMRNLLDSIISESDTPLEKIRKIHQYVIREIRYVGFELGLGSIQPRHTNVTYQSKMGDCKDVTLLLVALLRAAGIDAYLALIRTRDKGTANINVPYIGEFNHAICFVNYGPGFFIDGTASTSGMRELPAYDKNITALVINDKNRSLRFRKRTYRYFALINTGSKFYDKNIIEIENTISVQQDGKLLIKRKLMKKGDIASYARMDMEDSGKNKVHSLSQYWSTHFPGAKVTDYKIINNTLNKPVRYQYTVLLPTHFQIGKNEILLEPFLIKSDYYRNYGMKGNRKYPIRFNYPFTVKTKNKIIIPKGYKIYKLPKNTSFKNKKFSASFSYILKDNNIILFSVISLGDYIVGVKEYKKFRYFARFVNNQEYGRLILFKQGK